MATWVPTTTGSGTAFAQDFYGRVGSPYGSDALDPANPEVIRQDDMEVSLNHWGAGLHAYTKWSAGADQWRDVGLVFERTAGSLGSGSGTVAQVILPVQFDASALASLEGFGNSAIIEVAGEQYSAAFAKVIAWINHVSGTGGAAIFEWSIDWERFSTGGGQTVFGLQKTASELLANGGRQLLKLCVHCTSAHQTEFPVTPQDGSVELTLDGVVLASQTGIDPYLNWESGVPAALNKWNGLGIGFAGLPGPVGIPDISEECVDFVGDFPQDFSTECCSGGAPPGTSSTGAPSGDPTRPPQPWTAQCTGGGTVPTESDPAAAEAWA